MKQVDDISLAELTQMAQKMHEGIVKAAVDLARNVIVVDMGMHADGEAYLLEADSKQKDLWGINLHPEAVQAPFESFSLRINTRDLNGVRVLEYDAWSYGVLSYWTGSQAAVEYPETRRP